MTHLEDDIELRNLMARYVDAVHRRDADAWINTWAEDAEWNLLGNPVQGKQAILELWLQMMGGFEFALMLPSTCLFEVTGDSASGHWYLHEYTRDLEGQATNTLSRYLDSYVREGGAWRYKSRTYSFIYNGAPDMSGNYTPLA
ncbi:MAG: nuclear transport factor 2 family protein [Pseudomonadota bacterium]